MYLAINRFVPAIRSVFFVAAGISNVPPWKVVVFGGLSAATWNGLILAVGYAIGDNWDRLLELYRKYTVVGIVLAAVVLLVLGLRLVRGAKADDEDVT
jgi:membrane protein DedA with SNARE-associated domain